MGYFDSEHPTLLADPITPRDHVRGPASTGVTLVEYGDFSCSVSGEAYGLIKGLLQAVPDLCLVFRANPRSHFFPHAELAAEAAEAAGAQGKFWQMHDLLFENPAARSEAEITRLAQQLQLDVPRFQAGLKAGTYREVVHQQEISGWHSHVLATPTFFIDGVRFEDAPSELPAAIAAVVRTKAREVNSGFRDVRVTSTDQARRQIITVGPHQLVSDLLPREGGADAGPGPYDLLLSALGACTAMTLRWAADKHKLPLGRSEVRLSQSRTKDGHLFRRSIRLGGDLTSAQRTQLLQAVERCPVALTLKGDIKIDTRLLDE